MSRKLTSPRNIPLLAVVAVAAATLLLSYGGAPAELIHAQSSPPPQGPPAEPPQSGWTVVDDKLIPDVYAKLHTTQPNPDSDYIQQGRFYDVGWKYDIDGEIVHGEFRMRVTHIKFDWKDNASGGSVNYDEAFTIMNEYDDPLDHVEDGKDKGEWVYKYVYGDDDAGRSEPALYVADKQVKIMARIECAAPIYSAWVGAKEVRWDSGGSVEPRQWMDVKKTEIEFKDISGNETLCVSKGAGTSEYVELPLHFIEAGDETLNLKDYIDRSEIVWQWYVDAVKATDVSPVVTAADEWSDEDLEGWRINRSGKYVGEDSSEVVKPHKFYTVLDMPKAPWYVSDPTQHTPNDDTAYPWVTALDFAVDDVSYTVPGTSTTLTLRGQSKLDGAASLVTHSLYYQATFATVNGFSAYIEDHHAATFSVLDNSLSTLRLNLTTVMPEFPSWTTQPTKLNQHDLAGR